MTPEAALSRLRINTQSSSEPVLTDQELTDLLAIYSLADADERVPGSEGWVGTYDLTAASRHGWLIKAGKVAGLVNYAGDGAQHSLSDMHEHCLAMANRYQSSGSMTVGVS